MNKTKAKKFAMNESKLTYQDLENLVLNLNNINGMSIVNNNLPKKYVINEIFKPYFAELRDKKQDMNAIVKTTYIDVMGSTDKIKLTSDGMILINIIRECEYK